MSIIERVRVSGRCPPSLIGVDSDIDFDTAAVKVVDANGTSVVRLSTEVQYYCNRNRSWANSVVCNRSFPYAHSSRRPFHNFRILFVVRHNCPGWFQETIGGTLKITNFENEGRHQSCNHFGKADYDQGQERELGFTYRNQRSNYKTKDERWKKNWLPRKGLSVKSTSSSSWSWAYKQMPWALEKMFRVLWLFGLPIPISRIVHSWSYLVTLRLKR
jgi:hypothetical protein